MSINQRFRSCSVREQDDVEALRQVVHFGVARRELGGADEAAAYVDDVHCLRFGCGDADASAVAADGALAVADLVEGGRVFYRLDAGADVDVGMNVSDAVLSATVRLNRFPAACPSAFVLDDQCFRVIPCYRFGIKSERATLPNACVRAVVAHAVVLVAVEGS